MGNVKERIYEYCKYKGITIRDFERKCNLSNGYVSSMRKGLGVDKLNIVLSEYPDINRDWLVYGEGEMLKGETSHEPQQDGGLPLIPIDAVAGFHGVDISGVRLEDCERYSVPEFVQAHADFLIRVSGDSMRPGYSSGDVLACRKIDEITFIQWGKVYVIDSRQGAMVKRLFPIEEDEGNLLCKSDNADKYPPFKLPKSEIRSLSIVVGVIRME